MENEFFTFKQFRVKHSCSSMKVGVDAVLLGCWVRPEGRRILDVGTGCGIISLLLAQRNPDAEIIAIDIDRDSIIEASENFKNSPWFSRMKAHEIDFSKLLENSSSEGGEMGQKFDLIVSNPPYFNSGIQNPTTSREKARHQGSLSVFSLLDNCPKLLNEGGRLAFIFPKEFLKQVENYSQLTGWSINRICEVRNKETSLPKRIMIELDRSLSGTIEQEELVLFDSGIPTEKYRELCKDFYLKF